MFIDPVIYAIINITNDKHYVGQAVNKTKRWKDHKLMLNAGNHKNKYLQSAYNKYGKEAFIYIVLENLFDCKNLTEREQYWINTLNTVSPNGYNLNPNAASAIGFKHTEETKLKWSIQRKGKKRSDDFKLKISKSWETRIVSDEAKANMAKAQNGNTHSVETKAKMSASRIGNKNNAGKTRSKPTSAETRKKISEAKKIGYAKRKAALDKL